MMTAVCESLAERVAPARVEQHLTLLPLTTLLENLTGLYVPLLTGASSRVPPGELGFSGSSKLDPATLAQALLRWPSHSLVLVPELLRLLLALCGANPVLAEGLRGLRFVAVGGGKVAPISSAMPVRRGCRSTRDTGCRVRLRGRPQWPPGDRPGSVGLPCPHCRVTIAADGEVMVSSSAMLGYLGKRAPQPTRLPQASLLTRRSPPAIWAIWTRRAISRITGRKKNVRITAFGRNFSPGMGGGPGPALPGHRPHRHLRRRPARQRGPDPAAAGQPIPAGRTDSPAQPAIARLRPHPSLAAGGAGSAPGLLTANGRPVATRFISTFPGRSTNA